MPSSPQKTVKNPLKKTKNSQESLKKKESLPVKSDTKDETPIDQYSVFEIK